MLLAALADPHHDPRRDRAGDDERRERWPGRACDRGRGGLPRVGEGAKRGASRGLDGARAGHGWRDPRHQTHPFTCAHTASPAATRTATAPPPPPVVRGGGPAATDGGERF